MGDFFSSIALGGWGCPPHAKNHRADTCDTSADGGRHTRLDSLIDNDGPYVANAEAKGGVGSSGIAPEVNSHGKDMSEHLHGHPEHYSSRKHFFVSHHSAQGGYGLHQGHKEKD